MTPNQILGYIMTNDAYRDDDEKKEKNKEKKDEKKDEKKKSVAFKATSSSEHDDSSFNDMDDEKLENIGASQAEAMT
jgi:hypothetical protein